MGLFEAPIFVCYPGLLLIKRDIYILYIYIIYIYIIYIYIIYIYYIYILYIYYIYILHIYICIYIIYIYITSELLVKIHTASVTQPLFGATSTCELGPTLPPQKWLPFMAQDRPKRRLSPWTRRSGGTRNGPRSRRKCANVDCINSNDDNLEEQKLGFNPKQPRVYLVSPLLVVKWW